MPRPLLTPTQASTTIDSRAAVSAPSRIMLTGARLQQRLRQQRTGPYLEALRKLDAGTHVSDRAALTQLIAEISAEFPELTIEQRPVGILGRCYLGDPYDVHTLDVSLAIIEHFERAKALPALFERARALARHPSYAFIEVYAERLCAVAADGTVAVIES
ncbi:hypothetical protein TBR22_A06300 [Luteitalea sp. TBR-22]|uniref:hypothetical protein n=1 Tax=Luteitalea sp. TBR-22 TaxID=2802971 RepID=UPI001AF8A7BA|nr:hypothetical protein [Luteitalea sp. TBR-22]BCS31429.1 hypothetical protein TBR22_A06300 [Luteitalea sp. TBR-22]